MQVKRFVVKAFRFRAAFAFVLAFSLTIAMSGAGRAQEYALGNNDLILVTVYQNKDLTTLARISDDKIQMPLIGDVSVGGLTVREAQDKIAGLYAGGFLINPNVSIFIKEYHSKKITILGEVKKPGLYELTGDATLLEIISKAGGLTEKAGDEAVIKRAEGGENEGGASYIRVRLRDLTENGNLSANIPVQDKDSIFITKAGYIYVTGQVKKPGAYKYEEGATVMKAIALAEGLTDKAAPGKTEIIRKEDGREDSLRATMNTPVQPEDLVSVPESFF